MAIIQSLVLKNSRLGGLDAGFLTEKRTLHGQIAIEGLTVIQKKLL